MPVDSVALKAYGNYKNLGANLPMATIYILFWGIYKMF